MSKLRNLEICFDEFCHFDHVVGIYEFFELSIKKNKTLLNMFHKLKHDRAIKVLKRDFKDLIRQLNAEYNSENNAYITKTKNIFVMWYQGIDSAPKVVCKCIDSIKNNFPDYKIVLIDQNNVRNLSQLPDYIFNKLNEGKITFTHFSDLVRMALIYRYGGIWIDSTCYINRPYNFDNYKFFTIKHDLYKEWHVSKGRWSGFFLGAGQNSSIIGWYLKFFLEYWRKCDTLPCYFFIDCVMSIAYDTNNDIKSTIDSIPVNNTKVLELVKLANKTYDEYIAKELFDECDIFKLSYKINYLKDNDTFYNVIINKSF